MNSMNHILREVSPTNSKIPSNYPSKIEWDLTNGPLSKLLEVLYRYSGLGVRSVGPVGDFLETKKQRISSCVFNFLLISLLQAAHYVSKGWEVRQSLRSQEPNATRAF